jgi:outer membrane protein TolC
MKAAKVDARNAELEIKKQLIAVDKEVRSSFLKSSLAKQTIAETETQVDSAVEELRSARKRYELGLGTQLDVLTGQRDLTQAQINQATATIRYNNSQVELVHSIGMVSIQSLNAGSLK